jgi:hypothetical protein
MWPFLGRFHQRLSKIIKQKPILNPYMGPFWGSFDRKMSKIVKPQHCIDADTWGLFWLFSQKNTKDYKILCPSSLLHLLGCGVSGFAQVPQVVRLDEVAISTGQCSQLWVAYLPDVALA